jgi:hypothetical protein
MIPLPIYGGYYESDSLPLSAQQAINWYVNIPQTKGALSDGSLFGSAGINQLASSGTTPDEINRGAFVKAGLPYFINGQTLYRMDRSIDVNGQDSFSLASLGAITGNDRAFFASNGKQLMIVADSKGWIVDESAIPIFQQITDGDFTANGLPLTVSYTDSFFVVTTDSKKFIKSAANDGLNWNALDFGSAEADPDDIVGQIVFKRQVYIAGSKTFEVFENRGLGGFPFQRNGLIINKGLSGKYAIVETTQGIMFLGAGPNETAAIWLISGNDVQKVSTTAIDSVLNKYTPDEIAGCVAMAYGQAGAYFAVFTFAQDTFEYNTITQIWNQRESRVINPNGRAVNQRWRVNSLVSAYNRIICGDNIDGSIGEVSREVYSEYENPIVRTLRTMPFYNQGDSFSVSKLELTVESGVGLVGGEAPDISLSTSRGGKAFNSKLIRTSGKIGQYEKRLIWRKLGRFSRFTVLQFEMSAAVKPVIISLMGKIEAGNGN